jgi:hypothetical protein
MGLLYNAKRESTFRSCIFMVPLYNAYNTDSVNYLFLCCMMTRLCIPISNSFCIYNGNYFYLIIIIIIDNGEFFIFHFYYY